MGEHRDNQTFCCPERMSSSQADGQFCIPNNCPDKIATTRFSSPVSSLSPEELKQLQITIENTNAILRAISFPVEPNNSVAFSHCLRRLMGQALDVVINCMDNQQEISGSVMEVGRDFLQLESTTGKVFIPFHRIDSITPNICTQPLDTPSHQELIDIDPCLRRDLVLRFGEVVSQDLSLLNIFFGIPLYMQLSAYLEYQIIVKVEDEIDEITGAFLKSGEESIEVEENNTVKQIDLNKICYITM